MDAFKQSFLLLVAALLLHLPCRALAASELCNTSRTCQAFVGYIPPNNLKVKVIAQLFGVDSVQLFGANDFDITLPDIENAVLPAGKLLKIPQTCACINGTSTGISTFYVVQPNDFLFKIANNYYGGLVSYMQIAAANNISDPTLIFPGQNLSIPFPCACHNNTDRGLPAIFLSYLVQTGEDLTEIGKKYNTTASDLQSINNIANASSLKAGDVIFAPLEACSSNFKQGALDSDLLVAKSSYAITAGTCVQCSCGNITLNCAPTPASLSGSCGSMKCQDSELTIGNYSTTARTNGCTVTSCVYDGYTRNNSILTTLTTIVDPTCPAPPPPPAPLYKPPAGLAASPLGAPATAGGSPSPSSSSSPVSRPPASSSGPSTAGGPPPPGSSSSPGMAKWSPLITYLGLFFPFLILAGGW